MTTNPCLVQCRHIRDFDSADALHGQDAMRCELPINTRYINARVPGKVPTEAVSILAFPPVVQFVAECEGKFIHERGEIVLASKGSVRRSPFSHAGKDFQVVFGL